LGRASIFLDIPEHYSEVVSSNTAELLAVPRSVIVGCAMPPLIRHSMNLLSDHRFSSNAVVIATTKMMLLTRGLSATGCRIPSSKFLSMMRKEAEDELKFYSNEVQQKAAVLKVRLFCPLDFISMLTHIAKNGFESLEMSQAIAKMDHGGGHRVGGKEGGALL
jgi:hypothetical protein